MFQNGIDANTTGNVLYQTKSQAEQLGLISTNAAGNVIMKVDNTTSGANDPTFGRPSVKILSNNTIPPGSLVLLDAVHMPFGVRSETLAFFRRMLTSRAVFGVASILDAGSELAQRRRDRHRRECELGDEQSLHPPHARRLHASTCSTVCVNRNRHCGLDRLLQRDKWRPRLYRSRPFTELVRLRFRSEWRRCLRYALG